MKQKDILLLLIPSFLVIVAWVAFSIYHNSVASTIPEVLNMQITPISPNFDTNEVSQLKQRTSVTPIYEIQNAPSPSPSPSFISPPTSSGSGTPLGASSNSPQSTSGGTLVP